MKMKQTLESFAKINDITDIGQAVALYNKATATKTIAGYEVDESGVLINAPCGCWQCSDEGWQRGHPYCDNVPQELLALEESGVIRRELNGHWMWVVA